MDERGRAGAGREGGGDKHVMRKQQSDGSGNQRGVLIRVTGEGESVMREEDVNNLPGGGDEPGVG